jgi:VCBS repeat-containing protein
MRYEDASHTGFSTAQANDIEARDDTDTLAAGQRSAATGNVISGNGTDTGATGADQNAADARIIEIAGSQGADSSFAGGRLSANGQFGTLTIDAEGNYRYVANEGTPENSRDRFVYTLADNEGQRDSAAITFEIGKTQVKIQANAQEVIVGPDGVVVLPAGVQLSDIHVVGRNLVVDLPDGGQMIIIDGAVFVPQLVLGGVEVPATNLAALLVDSEPRPAAGETPPSSGGNFEVPVGPLDPGVPLGDLIPPTELVYVPPEIREIGQFIDREPEVFVDPGDGVPVENAVDSVNEAGLPTRNEGEPQGSGEEAAAGANGDPSETTTGTIIYDSPDDPNEITINGVVVVSVGQVIAGTFGNLTITSIADGAIGYSYTLLDNTSGNSTSDLFTVVVTDNDGDSDTATLTINIVDDVPTARPDTDSIAAGQYGPVTGNVITDASAGDAGDGDSGADTVGADNASITSVSSANVPANSDGGAPFVVNGQYGVLTLQSDGSYSYVRNPGTPGGVNDVFNYTLTDGDGDTSTTTLTISIADSPATLDAPDAGEAGTIVSEVGLPTRNGGEPAGTGEAADGNSSDNDDPSEATSGIINFSAPDGPAVVRIDGVVVTGVVGQTFAGSFGTLVITSYDAATGQIGYTYTLADNTSGNATFDDFAITVTDQDGDVASDTLVVNIIDDAPIAVNDTDTIAAGTYGPATGNVITDAAPGDAGDSDNGKDNVGADNATVSAIASNNVPANTDNTFTAGNLVVNGQYGVLTIAADGSYSYARNPNSPGGVNDVFTYTLTDGDGDTTTATLTITIEDSPATLDAPDQGEAGTVVDEQGLPTRNEGEPAGTGEAADGNSSDNDDTSEATSGVINFSAPDGPAVVRIDGVVVTGTAGQTFAGSFGTLVITSYDAATGQIGYTYTLADNTSGDATFDDFAISVTDADGDVANDTLVVNIIDDEPIAVNDTDSIVGGETTATGNVITDAAAGDAGDSDNGADNVGADNAIISGLASNNVPANSDNNPAGGFVVNGQYGTLTMQADGSYSYTRFDGTPGNFQDVFTYTLTDGDGDSDTATLTIDISDAAPNLPDPAAVLLDDDALAGGNPGGTGDDVNSSGTPGQLVGTGGDGDLDYFFTGLNTLPAGFSVNLVNAGTLQVLQGATVVLTVTLNNETGAYSVVQNNPILHPTLNGEAGDNTENNLSFLIGVNVTDVDNDTENATITINVDDDTPVAANDTDTIAGGGNTATGNVITDASAGDAGDSDTGADSVGADGGAAIVGLASVNVPANVDNNPAGGFVVVGQYGTLTLQADGSYSYTRLDGTPGNVQDVFTYTLTDADGDTTTATLTISIEDAAPNLPDPAAVLLDDDALAGGNPGGTGDDVNSSGTPGQLVGTGGDGDLDYFFTGLNTLPAGFSVNVVNAGQIQILQGATVVLTVTLTNETGAYTVVQNNPILHPTLNGEAGDNTENNLSFLIGVNVTDVDNDTENATITINVDDDTPVAANDTDTIASGSVGPATGNVITDNAAGDVGDGDTGADSVGADGGAAIVRVASNNVPANFDNDPAGGFVVAGQYGTLTMQADGSYSYLRNDGAGAGQNEVFTYTLTDADGDTTTATLTISIADATPNLPDPAAVLLDDDALAGGNPGGTGDDVNSSGTPGQLVGTGGDGDLDYFFTGLNTLPAGFSVNVVNAGQIQILQGATVVLTVTLTNETGAYTVVQNNPILHPTLNGEAGDNTENNLSFLIGVNVTDADNDTENATITINVDDDTPVAANDTDTIASGSVGPATGNVITDAAAGDAGDTDTGADSVGADGGAAIVGLASVNVPANVDNNPAGGFVVAGAFGTLTMQADGSYSYLRNDGAGAGQNEVFTYTLTDADGDTTTATLTISIADALPNLPDPAAVLLDDDALAGGNAGGPDDDVNSAGTPGQLVGTGGDGDLDYFFTGLNTLPAGFSVNVVNAGQIQILQGATVVLTVTLNNETGAYSVVQNNPILHPTLNGEAGDNTENNLSFLIGVNVTDVDNDTENATITINVDDDTPVNFSPVDLTDDTTPQTTPIAQDNALVNDGTAVATRLINDANNDGTGENFIGADGFGSLTFTATGHVNGEQLENSLGDPLTSGDDPIFVFGYGTGVLTATTDPTNTNPAAVVFTVTLNPNAGFGSASTYTIDFNQTIDNGAGVSFDNLVSAKAGNVDVRGVGADDPNTTVDLLLTASVNGANATINTDADSLGSGNQSMDQGETVRIDFVTNLQDDPNDDTATFPSGFSYDGHVGTQSLLQAIPQVQGSQTETVAFRVYALNTTVTDAESPDDTPVAGNPAFSDSTTVAITHVTVDGFDDGDPSDPGFPLQPAVTVALGPVGTWTTVAYGVSARLESDGSVTFTGIQQGDQYGIETGTDFNAVAVTSLPAGVGPVGNVSSTNSFDLGVFSIGQVDTGDPIDLSFDVTATDSDGDTSTGTIDVTLVPDTSGSAATANSTMMVSSEPANDTSSFSSLAFDGHGNGGNKPAANSNNLLLAAAVGAAGLSSTSAAALSVDYSPIGLASDVDLTAFTATQFDTLSLQQYDSASFGFANENRELAEQVDQFVSTRFDQGGNDLGEFGLTGGVADQGRMTDLLEAGNMMPTDFGNASFAAIAPTLTMPSAEALQAAGIVGGAQQGGAVEQILADALSYGAGAPTIDALLQGLPGDAEIGGLSAIDAVTSASGAGVPAWDMGFAGTSGPMADMMFKVDASMLHHDAVQPAVNG